MVRAPAPCGDGCSGLLGVPGGSPCRIRLRRSGRRFQGTASRLTALRLSALPWACLWGCRSGSSSDGPEGERRPRGLEKSKSSAIIPRRHVLPYVRPRVGPPVGGRIEALTAEEVVLDELS